MIQNTTTYKRPTTSEQKQGVTNMSNDNNNIKEDLPILTQVEASTIESFLGEDFTNGLKSMMPVELNQKIMEANRGITEAKQELEVNPNYVKAKQDMSYLRGGFTDVKKRQEKIIKYCLHLLKEKGKI